MAVSAGTEVPRGDLFTAWPRPRLPLPLLTSADRKDSTSRHRRDDLSRHLPSSGTGRGAQQASIRMRTTSVETSVPDRIVGRISQNLEEQVGDFVIFRADGITAYQLAVVVDDFLDNITHVVRGADLELSTPRQVYLQRRLGYPTPHYAHIPLVRDHKGEKISKRDGAYPVDPARPLPALHAAWGFLRQRPLYRADCRC